MGRGKRKRGGEWSKGGDIGGNGSSVRKRNRIQEIEHRPSFTMKKTRKRETSTFSWLCLIQKWEEDRNSRNTMIEKEKIESCVVQKKKSHDVMKDCETTSSFLEKVRTEEEMSIPTKEEDEESSLPDCVKNFLKRKRQAAQSLSHYQKSALLKMIHQQKKKKRKVLQS